jgi:hypothetical protein
LDHHIEILEAMLLFLIRLPDPHKDLLLYQYEKKVATVKQEIDFAVKQRQKLKKIKEMGIEYMEGNFLIRS